jgi:hypothetical protein
VTVTENQIESGSGKPFFRILLNYAEWYGANGHATADSTSTTTRHSGTVRHSSAGGINLQTEQRQSADVTPPFEVIHPPSKAATTLFCPIDGKSNNGTPGEPRERKLQNSRRSGERCGRGTGSPSEFNAS